MTIGEGTIDDSGVMDLIKAENSSILELIRYKAGEDAWDWWVSQNTSDEDIFNYQARRGSATSVQTFTIGDDTYINDYNKMRDDLYNYILILGPGASGSRIKSEAWADTLNFTNLDGALTAAATTITVDDTTDFPSSGYIWIGQEKIQYTGKTGTTFTGCTRGLLAQYPAYAHDDNILVRDGNNSVSSPESSSSIDENGLKQKTFEKMNLASQNEADRWAGSVLMAHKDIFIVIELRLVNHDLVAGMGDTVTVVDSDIGLNGDYKVVSIEQEVGYDTEQGETTILTVNNKPTTFRNVMDNISSQIANVTQGETYGTGVGTNSVIFSGRYNCSDATGTAGLGCKVNFYIPDEFTTVDGIKMAYTIRPSRAAKTDANYNVTIDGGGWNVTDVTIDVDGTDKTGAFETKNGTLVATEDGQMGDNWIEKGWFSSGPAGGEWHSLNLRPDANCHIEMDIEVIGTIVSPTIEYTASVWVSGGNIFTASARQDSLYLYDANANVWAQKADMPRALTNHAMCRAGNYLYVAGGSDSTPAVGAYFMQYDIAANTWTDLTSTNPLPASREAGALIYYSGNGKLYYFMGDDGAGNRVKKVYEYDPSAASGSRWSTKTDFPNSGINQFGSWLYNGKVYISGGYYGAATYSVRLYEYDISSDTWTRKADMIDAHGRARHAASEENGIGYVIGGWNNWIGSPGLTTAEKYTHSTNAWAAGDALASGASDLGCAEAQDLLFIIWSDYSKAFKYYNPSTGVYTSVASYPIAIAGIHNAICSKY